MEQREDIHDILDFWRAYDRLSHGGHCDAPGGAQSLRVFEEYLDARCPAKLDEFICRAANRPPQGKARHEAA
jgi:hypothetical protein